MNEFLVGLKNFLELIEHNWPVIIAIVGLVIGIYEKIKKYLNKSKEEQLEIAKKQIQEMILKLISDAEVDYSEWTKAGSIKRAQVIQKIYEEFPILNSVLDQEALTAWLDDCIDNALETLRDIIAEQKLPGDEAEETTPEEAAPEDKQPEAEQKPEETAPENTEEQPKTETVKKAPTKRVRKTTKKVQ